MSENRKTIGLVAPAGSLEKEELKNAVEFCKANGFKPVESKYLCGSHRHYSGTIKQRADDINDFLKDDSIDIIYAVRGGSGSPMLLDYIDWSLWKTKKKQLIGFSDITAFQLALYQRTGLQSLSGMSLVMHMTQKNRYINLSFDILKGKNNITEKDLQNEIEIRKHGKFSGLLIGGCLTMITTLIGTEYFPDAEDIILLIEDVNEPAYVNERNLVHLKQIGFLDKVKGLILGKFTHKEKEIDVWDGSGYLFENVEVVVSNFPYGHITDCVLMPIGVNAQLTTEPFKLEWEN
jgi:muramoyltetrapeptide carboxypeptidase